MSNTIFVNNDSVVDLQQYGKMENAKVVISGTDFKFIFPGSKEINVVNGALFSSLDKNSVIFKFQGKTISGQDLLKSVDLSNLELERLDSALSDQRQEHVLKDNIGKLSDVDAKSLEDAKKEAAELKQEAEKMRAEAEEARKASEDVERQLEEFLNDKAQNNTQNGATPQSDIEGQEGGNLYKKKYVDESVAEASRLQFSDYSSSSSSSSSSKSSDSTPVDQKPIDISLKLDEASDSGTKNDNITNITTPLFVGSTEPGLTVSLRIDGIVVAVTVADAMGNFSFTSSFLPDGEHSVQVDVSDGKGGSGSAKILVTIDTTIEAPTFELDDQYAIPEADRIEGENLTRFNNAKIVGEAEADSQVSIYANGHLLATVTVDSKGQWSYQFSGSELGEGINNIDIVATDKAGNSATTSGMITLDTIPPETPVILLDEASDTGMSQDDHLTYDKTPSLQGNAEPDSKLELYLNGYKVADIQVDSAGHWEYTLPDNKITSDGVYTFEVVASDRAGNTSSASMDITVDTNIDAFSMSMNSSSDSGIAGDNYTNNTSPSFSGKTDPSSHIVVTNLMTGEVVEIDASQSGYFSFTLAMASIEGINELSISVTDYAGNEQTFSYEYTIDTVAPVAPDLSLDQYVISLSGDVLTNDATPLFTGTAEAGSTVILYIDGKQYGTTTADREGHWSFNIPANLAEGSHTAVAYAEDLAGNISPPSADYTFSVDTGTLAPTAALLAEDDTGSSQTDWITRQNDNLSLIGTAEKYATITLKVDGKIIGTTQADENGNWQFEYDPNPALSDGDFTISVEARDEVGNTASSTYELVIDTMTITPSVRLDAASDTGSDDNDNITKETHPLLTGTAEANATIEIYIDGKLAGQAVTDKNGVWNYRLTDDQTLTDGNHTVMVKSTDIAGNSANSTPMTITVDSVIETPTIHLDSDSGTSNSDLITNNTFPVFSGTAEAYSSVVVYQDGKAIGKATADASGHWSYSYTSSQSLEDGSYIFYVTATDVAGNSASSEKIQVQIDTWVSVPTVDLADASDSGSSVTDNVTNDTTPTFTLGNIDADVVEAKVSINGTLYDAKQVGGIWQFTAPTLADGNYTIIVTVTDNAGNSQSSGTLAFTVDTVTAAPVITLTGDTGVQGDNQTNDSTPGFAITADTDAVSVMVSIDGGAAVAATKDADGQWHITSGTLTDGDHSISVTVTDLAGNTSSASLTFNVDTTLSVPTIDLADASDSGGSSTDNVTNDSTPAFTLGNIDADVTDVQVLINGTAYSAQLVDGTWQFTAPALADGDYTVTVQVTDDAGNIQRSSALDMTIDTVTAVPVITLTDDTGVQGDSQTNDSTPGFAITTDTDAVTVMVSIDGGAAVAATKDADGQWHITSGTLTDGDHSISVTVTDLAGNTSSASLTFNVDTTLSVPTIDLVDASDSGSSNTDNVTNDSTPAFTLGNIDADVTDVQVLINGTAYSAQLVDDKWQFTAPALADGDYTVTVQVTDDAGNTKTSAALDVTIDTVTAVPVITLTDDTGVQGDSQTNDTTPGFAIATDTDAVSVMVSIDGGAAVAATKDADGQWHITSGELADGDHSISVTVTDLAGNTSSASLTFNVDTTLSVPTIDLADASDSGGSSTDNVTNDSTPAFMLGNIDADVTDVQVLINGTAYSAQLVDGKWQFTAPELADGDYTVTVQVTDDAGNTKTSAALDVTIDTVTAVPVITLTDDTGVQGDSQTNDTTPGFAIATDTDAVSVMVSIDGGAAVAATKDADGQWHITSGELADGDHSISVTVTDLAGNTSSASLTFTVDTTLSVPTVDLADSSDAGSSSTDNITNDSTPTFTLGNIDADVTDVQVLINGTAYSAQLVDGTWQFTAPALADGDYTVTVQVTDDAGNIQRSSALDMTIDTVTAVPVIVLSDDTGVQGDSQTNDTTPGFTITTDTDAVSVMVSIDGGTPVPAVRGSAGQWFITSGDVADGDHSISAVVTDLAGNTSSASLTFNVDTTLSVPTIDLADSSDTGSSNTDNITRDSTPTFTLGNIDADVTDVQVLINGTAHSAQFVDGKWQFTAPELADGDYTVTVQVTDDAGNIQRSAALDMTIDTVTAAPVITLSDDTGVQGDSQTNDTTPGFAIATDTDAVTVMVSIDGGAAVAAIKDADGKWHFTSGELADGDHSISVVVTDLAGNTSNASLTFTVDTTLSIPTLDMVDASDSGSSSTDNITNDSTPVFTLGNIDADVTDVQVLINGTAYSAQQVDGKWRFTAPALADGDYTVTVQVTDDAGNIQRSAALDMTIDTVTAAPVITLSDDTGVQGDSQTNDTTPGFAITTDNDAVSVMVSIDGGAAVAATKDADGKWHFTSGELADGDHSISVTVTDLAGNTSNASLTFTVDTTLSIPTLDMVDASDSGSSSTDNITNDSTPVFTLGNIDADVTDVQVLINGTAYSAQLVDGRWQFTAPALADGDYTVTVQVTDDAGNAQTSAELHVTVDTVTAAPVITLSDDTGVQGDSQTNDTTPGFAIATDTDAVSVMVSIDGGAAVAATKDADGKWHFTSGELADGDHSISVTVTDLAGNTSNASLTFTVDTTLSIPTLDMVDASDSGSSSTDNITNDSTPVFTLGNIDADVTDVQVLINGTAYSAQLVDGRWQFTAPALADGDYTVTGQVTDDAGNIQRSAALDVTIDTVTAVPVITLTDDTGVQGDNQTNDTTPGFAIATDTDAVSVMVSIDGGAAVAATKDADGQWHFTSGALADGDHSISVTVTDLAGNTSNASLTFTVDTTLSIPTLDMVDASDSGSSSTDNITNDSTPTFTLGNIDADVTDVQVLINGTGHSAQLVDGKWQFTAPALADGNYTVTVQVTDDAGNIQRSAALDMTIDTVTAVPVITLTDDTGVQGDSQTNDTTPVFAITTDNDAASVMVSIDGGLAVAAIKDADGKWHFTSGALADGDHSISVTVTDLAGNTSSASLTFTVDTTLSVPTIDLADASDSGSSSTDNITNDSTPTFTLGNIDADVTDVQVLINGTAYTVQQVGGVWQFTAPVLTDGDYSVIVKVTDDAGNTRQSPPLSITVDTVVVAPVITLSDDTGVLGDNQTNVDTPTFAIRTDVDVVSVMVSIDGGAAVPATLDSAGQWRITSSKLVEGNHSISVMVTDNAGNTSSSSLTFNIDTTLSTPTVDLADTSDSGISNTDNITNDNTPAFKLGNIDPDVTDVQVILNGTVYDAQLMDGVWIFNAPVLADGDYTVVVKAIDDAGNERSSSPVTVTIDTDVQPVTIALDKNSDTGSSATDNYTSDTTPTFNFSNIPADVAGTTLTINGKQYAIDLSNGTSFTLPDALPDGNWTATVTVVDIAGNQASSQLNFTIDTEVAKPTIDLVAGSDSGDSQTDDLTNTAKPQFRLGGVDVDDCDFVTIVISGTDGKYRESWTVSAKDYGEELWNCPVSLSDSSYQITVTTSDLAGNKQSSDALNFEIDTVTSINSVVLLDDTGSSTTDNLTNVNTPEFAISAPDDVTHVSILIDGKVAGSAIKQADGKWHFTAGELADGAHTLSVTVTDKAGNISQQELAFTVDTTLSTPTLTLTGESDSGYSNSDHITNDVRPTFIIGNVDSDVVSVTLNINGQSWPVTIKDGIGEFTVPVDLADGVWQAELIVVDNAGNTRSSTMSITIDTVTSVDAIVLQSDTGVQNDWMTNETKPTFAITAPSDAQTVVVTVGSMTQNAVNQDGKWVITLPSALSDGEYTLHVTVTDKAGNTADRTQNFTIDTTLEPLTVQLTDEDDSGIVDDNITNVTTPSFIMGNIPEDVYSIEVILNGVKTTLTPQSDGRWLYTPDSALAEGNYTLQAVVTDNAGNQRTTSYAFTVDTTVKISSITLTTDTGDSSTDDVTNASQPVFRVTTSDDVISVVATLNGVPCTVVKNSDGEWTVTSSVLSTSGEYTLNVTVQDVAGNETSSTKTITFDNSLSMPVVAFAAGDDTGYDDGDHLTADNKPSFVITNVDSDVTYISVTLNGRTTPLTQDAKGNWIFTPSSTLSDGDYTLTVDVQDLAGNTRQQNFSFTIDTTLSTPTIDMNTASDTGDLTDDNLTSNTRPQFTIGNVDSDIYSVVVTLNNVDYTLTKNTQGQWAFQAPTLTDGIYTLEVTVTDKAGNVRSSSLDFEVDTITAIDSIIMSEDTGYSSVDHLTKDTQPSFEINVPDDVSHVTVTLDNGTAVELVKSNGKWVYSVEGVLEDGSHRLVVEVVDKAGNKASDTFTFEVDTTLHPVTIDLATADDSGSSPMDNYTNVTQPTFTFGSIDSDAYSLVVTLNGKTYNVDLSSKPVSFTPPDVLADGTYTMSAVITDKAGNAQETTLSFTIDTHTSVDVDFVVGDDTGYSDSDNITNNNAPNFEVIVPSDVESVTVVLNGVTTILTQDETGRWLYQTPSLVDGHYDLQINVVDKAGNTASKTLSFEVDTTLNTPTIDLADVSDTGTSSNDSLTKDNTPYFVIGNIDSDAHSVTVSINNKTYNASLKDGVWGLQIPEADALVDGVYTATVRVEDNAGNVKTASTTITVDTFCPAPIVELDDATNSGSTDDNITNITQPVINISGEPADIASVTVSIGSQSWTLAPGTTQWMVPDALPDGSYNIVVAFTDNAGNKGTTTYNVVVDTVITSPTVVLLDDTGSDAHDNLTNVAAPRFQIYAAEDLAAVSVTLNGRTTSLVQNDKGQWIYTADTLADGTWTLTVDMYDLAGNYHSDTLTFTIDTQIPQPTIDLDSASDSGSSDSDNLTNITQPKFIISGIPDDVDSVSVQIGGVKYAAIQDGNGEWSVTPAKLADGDYTATVTVTDKAGNASSNAIDFTIDTKIALSVDMRATSDTGDSQTDRLTHDTSPTFGGVTDKDAKLTISVTNDKGEVIQTLDVMPAADGTWSVTLGDLVDGSYTITVTAVDRAGNQATASQNFEIDTIVSAPVVALSASDPENYHEALSLTPEFSGTAEPGSTLKIMIDGVSVGSVTTDSNGSWAWTPPSAMTAGDHIIGVIATDKAGNISDRTDFTFIIPLIDVDPPTLQLQTDSDSGAIGDFITNDTTPTLTGISLPGNTVTIYIDGKVAGTAPTDSTGRYNFNLPEMAEGTYSIVVSIVNPNNGEEVKSSPASLVVDTHVEPLTWDIAGMNEAGYINTSSPTVHGTSEAGARIVVMVDGNVVVETVAASDGTWLASMPNVGSDGEHELSFTVTDVAGNATDFGPQTFIVDTYITPITVDLRDADDTGSSATDNITRNTLVHLDGSAEANAIITIANAKGEILATVTADDNGNWSSEIALQEGNQTFIVTETDIAGNTASKSIDITCDTQNSISAVVLSRDSNSADTNDSITNVNTPTLTAATDPMSSVDIYVNGVLMATVTADAAGSVSWTMPESADGTYAVKMVSTDTAGNIATSDTAVVVIDTVIDSFSVDALPELTNKTGLNVSGTGEVGATVMLYLDGVAVGQGTVNADGIWDIQVILSKDGDYTLTTTITDAAGNTLSSDPFLFTLDSKTDYPTIKLDDASNSGSLSDTITNDNTPSFHGTAEAGATVSILVNEVVVATVTADAQGQWTWQYPATFADGEYSIRVIAEDAAGNTADSARMLLTVDTSTWIEVDKMTTDSGFYNNDYYTSKVIPTFQINGETGQPVDVYIDGKYVETITITGRNYLYTVPEALGDGKHTIRFDISDAAGNTASTGERTFTIDTVNNTAVTLDTINGESIADHTVNDTIYINDLSAGVKFSGTAEENSYVTVTINGMTVSQVWANDQGGWSVNINSLLLSDSNWNVKVTSQDKAGNSTSSTFSIVVDTSISQFTANVQDDKDSSIDKWTVNSRTPTFNGVGEAGATVTLLVAGMVVATTTVAADGTWSITTDQLSEGNNALTFKIEDPAGNTQEIQHDLLVDSVVPTVPTIEISTWNSEGSLWILSGHAEAGTTVVIKDEAGNILNTVTVSSSGSWSTAISYPDGGKITVQAQDSATNISDPVALDVMFTTPVIALDTASDSGLVGDSLTNDSTPTFVLSNVEKDVVSLSVTINGKTVQATQVSTGVWSVTWTEPLVDGLTNVQIKATDGAGNTASQSWSFTVDTFISAATIVLNADSDTGVVGDNITQNPTPGFTLGNIDADVTKVEVTLNGVTSVVVKDEEGNWIYTPDSALTDGKWTLDVKVTDAAGNTAHSSLDFTIDTGINTPVVTLDAQSDTGVTGDNLSSNPQPGFVFTNVDADVVSVQVTLNGKTYNAVKGDTGSWTFTPDTALPDGKWTLDVNVTDTAGNTACSSLDFTIDTTISTPVVSMDAGSDTGVAGDNITSNAQPAFTLSNIDADATQVQVTVNGKTYDAEKGESGDWTFTPETALPDGQWTLDVKVTDAAGNTAHSSLDFTIDTTISTPVVTMDAGSDTGVAGDNITSNTQPAFILSDIDADVTRVQVTLDGNTYDAVKDESGNWTFTPDSPLAEGHWTLEVNVTDTAGNTASQSVDFTVDNHIETFDVTFASNSGQEESWISDDSTLSFTGHGEAGADITVKLDNGDEVTTRVNQEGNWNIDIENVDKGTHELVFTITDQAGNTSSYAHSVDVETDTPALLQSVRYTEAQDPAPIEVESSHPVFEFSLDADVTHASVELDGTVYSLTPADSGPTVFEVPVALEEGPHTLVLQTKDNAGNSERQEVPFTVDTSSGSVIASMDEQSQNHDDSPQSAADAETSHQAASFAAEVMSITPSVEEQHDDQSQHQ